MSKIRNKDSAIRIVAQALKDANEIKTKQFQGKSQIVYKPYQKAGEYDLLFTLTRPITQPGYATKTLRIIIDPIKINQDNILIANLVALVKDYSTEALQDPFIKESNPLNPQQIVYLLTVGGTMNQQMTIKCKIEANAEVNFTIEELN